MIIDELFESPQQCPECGGISFSDLILAEKKDACYHKVKASAKVWPSAYASGRLVQCRKKGAANYGNKSEGVAEAGFPGAPDVEMPPMNPSGDPQRDKLKQEYMDLHREIKSLVDLQYRSTSDEQKMQAKARIEQLNDRADQIKAILEPRQPPNEWQKKTYGFDDNWNKVNQGVAEGSSNAVTFFRGEPILSQERLNQLKSSIGKPYPILRKEGVAANIGTYMSPDGDKATSFVKQALAGQGKGGVVTQIQVNPNSFSKGDGGIDEAVIITNIAGLVSNQTPNKNDPLRIQDRKQAMLKYLGPGVKKYLNDPLLSDPKIVQSWYNPEFAQKNWNTINSGKQAVTKPGESNMQERMMRILGPLAENIRRDPEVISYFISHNPGDWVEYNFRMNSDGSGTKVVDVKYYPPAKQGVAEGQLESNTPDPVVVVQDLKGNILDKINLSVAAQKYKLGPPQNIKTQLAHQNYTTIGNYTIVSPMSGQPQDQTTIGQKSTFATTEGEQQKGADYRDPKEADYGDDYQAMVARVKKLAGLGPMKTVYDPARRQYRNIPTAQQPKK